MKAYFDEDNKLKVDIAVVGLDETVEVTASIDTGFNGYLMLSLPLALSIGLKLINVLPIGFADTSIQNKFVFDGTVLFGKKKMAVEILLTSSEESLLGTALLQEHKLTVDWPRRTIEIIPSTQKTKTISNR